MKINAKKSYFVIGFAPFQGLSLDRLPIDGKRLSYGNEYITSVIKFRHNISLPSPQGEGKD